MYWCNHNTCIFNMTILVDYIHAISCINGPALLMNIGFLTQYVLYVVYVVFFLEGGEEISVKASRPTSIILFYRK